jgi:hypothetical protein
MHGEKTEIAFFFQISIVIGYWSWHSCCPCLTTCWYVGAKKTDSKIRQPQMGKVLRLAIKLNLKPFRFMTLLFIISHWFHLNSKANKGKIYCTAEAFSSSTIAQKIHITTLRM